MNVVVHGAISALGREVVAACLQPPAFSLAFTDDDDPTRLEKLAGCEVVVVDGAPLDEAAFDAMPRLRLVQRVGRGPFDISCEIASAHARGIPLAHNRSGFAAQATAEHTVMTALVLLRRLFESDRFVRSGEWLTSNRFDASTTELAGRSVALIGMGRIATAVARLLAAFGAEVSYWSRTRLPVDREAQLALRYVSSLPELLSDAEIVSLHVRASTPAEFRFGSDELSAMRHHSYFINTSRGKLVDEEALADALIQRRLAGAALDVFDLEPLAQSSRILAAPNLILSPHVAGRTRQVAEQYFKVACANIARVHAGQPAQDLIEPVP